MGTAFGKNLADSNCVNCGQCSAICPTGAICERDDVHLVKQAIKTKGKIIVFHINLHSAALAAAQILYEFARVACDREWAN